MSTKVKSFLIFILSFFVLITSFGSYMTIVSAEESDAPYYLSSSVLSDLSDDPDVTESELATSYSGLYDNVHLIKFLEYGFDTDQFGLYIYVYNPFGLPTSDNLTKIIDSPRNKIQIGFSSEKSSILKTSYSKYTLSLIDESTNNLFLKFKVENFSSPSSLNRFYCISGLELLLDSSPNATEFSVSTIYKCFTVNDKTTISTESLESLEVDVEHTFFRSGYSNRGDYWSNQLSSCYFSLPSFYSGVFSNYGELSGVTAEFYNYYTKEIILSQNADDFQSIYELLGKDLLALNSDLQLNYGFNGSWSDQLGLSYVSYDVILSGKQPSIFFEYRDWITSFYWLFYEQPHIDVTADDYFLPANDLLRYFNGWVDDYLSEGFLIDEARQKTIDDLFISSEKYNDSSSPYNLLGLDYGYNNLHYSVITDNQDITSDDESITKIPLSFNGAGAFLKFFGFSLEEEVPVDPLVKISYSDLSLSNDEFSKKYFIDISQVPELKAYCSKEKVKLKDVWLFRYDACEYHFAPGSKDGFLAQESVYLDFDVLSFDFSQENTTYTIPVLHSPEDVFSPVGPAPEVNLPGCLDSFSNIFRLVLLSVLIAFIVWLFSVLHLWPYFFNGLWWIVKSPFLFVKWIIDQVNTRKSNKSKNGKKQPKSKKIFSSKKRKLGHERTKTKK